MLKATKDIVEFMVGRLLFTVGSMSWIASSLGAYLGMIGPLLDPCPGCNGDDT